MRVPPAIIDEHGGKEGSNMDNNEDGDDPGVASSSTRSRLVKFYQIDGVNKSFIV